MDEDEEALSGARSRRAALYALGTLPVIALGVAIGWYLYSDQQAARDTELVDRVTDAAFGCVASLRGDSPETWGLERALEHMARAERLTRDAGDPTTLEIRQRFNQIASDAAEGCEQLGQLMARAHEDAPHLYFAVPASLAQPPDRDHPDVWFRRTIPQSRSETLELTRQIRTMAETINDLRAAHQLMQQVLPIEGRGPDALARLVELTPLPREREDIRGEAWPLARGVFVLRRGAIGRVPCETRFLARGSCFNEFLQSVSWDGGVAPLLELERPDEVSFWVSFTMTPDGTLWAVGLDQRNRGVVGRYAAGATNCETGAIAAAIDVEANIVAVAGAVAVFPADGSAWLAADGSFDFQAVTETPQPVTLTARRGPAEGIELEGYGRLTVSGTEESGYVSRLSSPSEEQASDVVVRVLDAHSRVSSLLQLRALHSGRAVVLLERSTGPDALLLTNSFGAEWLSEPTGTADTGS